LPVRANNFWTVSNHPFAIAFDDCREFIVHGILALPPLSRITTRPPGTIHESTPSTSARPLPRLCLAVAASRICQSRPLKRSGDGIAKSPLSNAINPPNSPSNAPSKNPQTFLLKLGQRLCDSAPFPHSKSDATPTGSLSRDAKVPRSGARPRHASPFAQEPRFNNAINLPSFCTPPFAFPRESPRPHL
jgi:hypothetical protein